LGGKQGGDPALELVLIIHKYYSAKPYIAILERLLHGEPTAAVLY